MNPNKRVADVMHSGVIHCTMDTLVPEVARRITKHDISAMIVVDMDGCLAGIISRTDLTVLYGYDEMWPHMTAQQAMKTTLYTVAPGELATVAAQRLHQEKISRLIVTEPTDNGKEKPIGILSITDIVRDMSLV